MSNLKHKLGYLAGHPAFQAEPAVVLFRLLMWRCHCALGIPGTFTLPPSGQTRMRVPPRWRGHAKLFFAFRERFERELTWLPHVLSEGGVFADVGACYGIYSLVAAQLVGKSGTVIAFEPAADTFSVLRRNLEMNEFPNAIGRNVALMDEPGTVRLWHHGDPAQYSLGADAEFTAPEEVEASTLDHEVGRASLRAVNVVKIDAEGAEEFVLRGAEETLSSYHPVVILEANARTARRLGLRPEGPWDLLQQHGYRLWQLDASGGLRTLASLPEFANIVATRGGT